MRPTRVIAFGFALTLATESAAEPIDLRCSGQVSFPEAIAGLAEANDLRVTLDYENRVVSGFLNYSIPIVRTDRDTIVFSQVATYQDGGVINILGNIDRMTGRTFVFATRQPSQGRYLFSFDLSCTRARPLF
jgi:hypothetical protein